MKKTTVFAAILAAAFAAPAAAQTNWTGFHVGVNGGLATGNVAESPDFARPQASTKGGLYGLQLGYSKQFEGGVVLGVETDIQKTGISGSRTMDTCAGCFGFSSSQTDTTSLEWLGTTRLRLGYAAGRWLPYATAGLAYGSAKVTSRYDWYATFAGVGGSSSNATTQGAMGYALGAGLDVALTKGWSARLEYLRTDLSLSKNENSWSVNKTNLINNTVRVGVNYTF